MEKGGICRFDHTVDNTFSCTARCAATDMNFDFMTVGMQRMLLFWAHKYNM